MIVVSNTSPLTNLAAIGHFDLLRQLYSEIHIAEGVWQELNAYGQAWPGSAEVNSASWVVRHTVQNRHLVTALRRDLDMGEAESIALAIELDARLVLLDESDGRKIARRYRLEVIGVLGVLLEAKQKGYVTHVMPLVSELRVTAGFYLSPRVEQTIRELADE